MKNRMTLYFIAVIVLFSNYVLISQGMMVNTSLEIRIENSFYVIEGVVIDKNSTWDADFKSIYTINEILILNKVKGIISSDTIEIITPGGIVDNEKIEVYPALKLYRNDAGLFILNKINIKLEKEKNNFQKFKPEYSKLSFIKYNLDDLSAFDDYNIYQDIERDIYGKLISMGLKFENNLNYIIEQKMRLRSPNTVSISSFSPPTITAGTQSELTIYGSGFGSSQGNGKVEFRNSDNGGSGYMGPISSEYVSWSNTQIKVKVPSGAGTGDIRVTDDSGSSDVSSTDLQVTYNLTNITYNGEKYRPNLVDADNSGGIEFEFYTDFYNDADAMGAFGRALDSWRCSDGTGVYFEDGGSSNTDEAADDDVNIVRFDNDDELPAGVLGRTKVYYSGCGSGGVVDLWFVPEIDMVFNDNGGGGGHPWNFDEADGSTAYNEYDFESVAVHELGHGQQLGHVIDASQVMHYSIANGQEKRSLSSDDLDAGNDVLDYSSGVCGMSDMSTYACTSQPLNLIYFNAGFNDKSIKLIWGFDNINDLDHVNVLKSLDGLNFYTLKCLRNDNVDFVYYDRSPTKDNYYKLMFIDTDGLIKYSKIVFVFNEKVNNDIKIYPNPVQDVIQIENNERENSILTLINSKGDILKNWRAVESIDMKGYPAGVYFIKITTPSKSIVKKVYKSELD